MSAQTVQRRRSSCFPTLGLIVGLSLALFAGAACGGEPDPSGADYGALLEYLIPDRFIPEEVWQTAPASCGGILSDDMIRIGHAAGAPALGVVLDEVGRAICVDTWDAIHIELSRIKGDPSPDPMMPIELPADVPGAGD
ncbi:MAG: hypothetical protein JRH11_06270 [Deltaproteobacteria bacterium]|nr:hypothetical protein [Deltaproteobacteria bacterium]